MLGAILHRKRSGGERFFGKRLELQPKTRLALCENPQSFNGGGADNIRGIVVERHQQTGCARPLGAGVSDAGGYQSEVRAGSPVVAAALAEESDHNFGVRLEQRGLLFGDAARRVGCALAKPAVSAEQRLQQRPNEARLLENLRCRALCTLQSPGAFGEMQIVLESSRGGHQRSIDRALQSHL